MGNELLQAGGVLALGALIVRELFAYLKSRNGSDNSFNEQIFEELRKMNTNHLHDIRDAIMTGNERIVDTLNVGNMNNSNQHTKQIELLGEITGKLSK